MIKFRSDVFYGNGGHAPAEILAYETLCLENFWILEDLYSRVKERLSDEDKIKVEDLLASIVSESDDYDEDYDYTPHLPIFEIIVRGLEKIIKKPINYLLWLADINVVLELYYDHEDNIDVATAMYEIDAYQTGVEIIHLEGDGNLYAYAEKPKPLDKKIVEDSLENMN